MAQLLTYATTSEVYEVEGATVDVQITPSVTAYMRFYTSPDGVNWDILLPGAVYTEPISRTFTQPELGAFIKCEVYGGIGSVTLSASGRTIPPLVVDAETTIASSDMWAGNTLTLTPATFSGGTTPYELTYKWQMKNEKWENVGTGLSYTIPDGDQFYGKQVRAQTRCVDSSNLWDVPDNSINSNSSVKTIVEEPVPDIVVTQKTGITGTVKVGQILTAIAPVWTGGGDESSVTSYQWLNEDGALLETSTAYIVDNSQIGKKLLCQATISSTRQNIASNSDLTIIVPPLTEIGPITVTINDIDYDYNTAPALTVLMNDPCRVVVTHAGDADGISYGWLCRQGSANNTITNVEPDGSAVDITMTAESIYNFSCSLTDSDAEDSPKTVSIAFYVVDAFRTTYTIGATELLANGQPYTGSFQEEKDENVAVAISYDGDLPPANAVYNWRKTSGGGSFEGPINQSTATFNTGFTIGTNLIYCDISGEDTSDSPVQSGPITISVLS
jgi:hypothetical protein